MQLDLHFRKSAVLRITLLKSVKLFFCFLSDEALESGLYAFCAHIKRTKYVHIYGHLGQKDVHNCTNTFIAYCNGLGVHSTVRSCSKTFQKNRARIIINHAGVDWGPRRRLMSTESFEDYRRQTMELFKRFA